MSVYVIKTKLIRRALDIYNSKRLHIYYNG